MTRSSKAFSLLKNSINANIFLRVADLSLEINSAMMMPEVNRAVETHQWRTVALLTKSTFSSSQVDKVYIQEKYCTCLS